jgi:transcriptional regulator with XRE-family HTH domain
MTRGKHTAKRATKRETSQDGRRLKRRRLIAEMTIRQLSGKAGVSIGSISMAERGLQSLGVDALARLAGALGCDIADLLPDEPNGAVA